MDLDGVRNGALGNIHGQDDRGLVLVFDVGVAVHTAAGGAECVDVRPLAILVVQDVNVSIPGFVSSS